MFSKQSLHSRSGGSVRRARWQVLAASLVLMLMFSVAMAQRSSGEKRTFEVKKGGTLIVDIENAGADISVEAWNKSEVQVRVSGISDEDIEDLEMRQKGNEIEVRYYGGERKWRRSRHAHFMISVPSEFNLDLSTSGGDVEVDGKMSGRVEARTSGGDMEVDDVDGELALRTSGGDITARNVKGDADLKTSGGDIEIEDVDGELSVATSGGDIGVGTVGKDLDAQTAGGDIVVGDVGGFADVSTAGGDIRLGKVSGTAELRTAGGDIELLSATGRVSAQTAGGDIELENISGSIDAQTAGGDIIVELIPGGHRGSSFDTAGGDIELYLPADAKVNIDARIRLRGWHGDNDGDDDYEIFSDFKSKTENRNRRTITATFVLNGGGKTINLETTNGDIEIRKMK